MTRQLAASPGPLSGSVASRPRKVSAEAESVLDALTQLFRGGGAVLIGVATFGYSAASGRDLVIEVVAFAVGALVVAHWLVADLRPGHPKPRVLAGALIIMAAASGFASMGAHGGPLIGFAFMAVIGAGAGSSLLTGCVTTAVALVGVEAGALVTAASATSALGFPLLLIVAFVSGRNRAAYRRQAEQSAALVGADGAAARRAAPGRRAGRADAYRPRDPRRTRPLPRRAGHPAPSRPCADDRAR